MMKFQTDQRSHLYYISSPPKIVLLHLILMTYILHSSKLCII